MSITRFLNLARTRFTPDMAKAMVSAFRAEPLVWKALASEELLNAFQDFAGEEYKLWQPGLLAVFALSPKLAAQILLEADRNLEPYQQDRIAAFVAAERERILAAAARGVITTAHGQIDEE